jgi:hypothetical protein
MPSSSSREHDCSIGGHRLRRPQGGRDGGLSGRCGGFRGLRAAALFAAVRLRLFPKPPKNSPKMAKADEAHRQFIEINGAP